LFDIGGGSKGLGIKATLFPVEPFSPINPFSPIKPFSPIRPVLLELLDEEVALTELFDSLDCELLEELAEAEVSLDTVTEGEAATGDSVLLALGEEVGTGTGVMGVNRLVGKIGFEVDVDVEVPLGVAFEAGVKEFRRTTASCAFKVEVERPEGFAGVVFKFDGEGSVTPLESAVVLFCVLAVPPPELTTAIFFRSSGFAPQ
jgi:hypothetical protein